MHPFSTPWKHQKTLRQRKGALGTNRLNKSYRSYKEHKPKMTMDISKQCDNVMNESRKHSYNEVEAYSVTLT